MVCRGSSGQGKEAGGWVNGKYHRPARGKINIVKEIKMCFKKRVKPENKLETNTYNSEAREKIIQECVKSGIGGNHYNKLDCIPKIIYIGAEDSKPAPNGFMPAYKVGFSYHGKNNTIIHYYDSPSF